MAGDRTNIVVILGSGRSGTSLTMNIAHRLGINVSTRLIPENETNLKGAWEDADILEVSRKILHHFHRSSWKLSYLPMPDGWLEDGFVIEQQEVLKSILVERVHESGGKLWGFKEPVTAKLLPMWKEVFKDLSIDPIYILSLRNPANVVDSFMRNYDASAQMSELLWMSRYHDAIKYTGGDFLVADFDQWFECPELPAKKILTAINTHMDDDDLKKVLGSVIDRGMPKSGGSKVGLENELTGRLYEVLKGYVATQDEKEKLMVLNEKVHEHLELFSCCAISVDYMGERLFKADEVHADLLAKVRSLSGIVDNKNKKILNNDKLLKDKTKRLAELDSELGKYRDLYNEMRGSASYRLGEIFIKAVTKPGLNTILLPYYLIRLLFSRM